MLCFLLLCAPGCGGGTSGTSPTDSGYIKLVQGIVTGESGTPIAEASIRIPATGQTVLSDNFGRFSFEARLQGNKSAVEISKDGFQTAAAELTDTNKSASIVGFEVQLGESQSSAVNFELAVKSIGGAGCDGAFGPPRITNFLPGTPPVMVVEQLHKLAPDVDCMLGATMLNQGAGRQGEKFQLAFMSKDEFTSRLEKKVISDIGTDAAGNGSHSFKLGGDLNSSGYVLLEGPANRPSEKRVGIVVSLLKEVK